MVAEGKASDILEGVSGFATVPGLALSRLIQTRFASSEIAGLQVDHLHGRMMSKTFAPIATWVTLATAESEQKGGQPESATLDPQNPKEEVVRLDGTAVFKGDKLTGKLDLTGTRGYLWLSDEVETGILVVVGPGQSGKISLEILNASSSTQPEMRDGNVKMKVKVKAACNLAEQFGEGKLVTPEHFTALEQLAAERIKYEITLALNEAKRLKADIFGFGESVRRSFPNEWSTLEQEWDQAFEQLDLEMDVEVRLRRFGQIAEMPHPKP